MAIDFNRMFGLVRSCCLTARLADDDVTLGFQEWNLGLRRVVADANADTRTEDAARCSSIIAATRFCDLRPSERRIKRPACIDGAIHRLVQWR